MELCSSDAVGSRTTRRGRLIRVVAVAPAETVAPFPASSELVTERARRTPVVAEQAPRCAGWALRDSHALQSVAARMQHRLSELAFHPPVELTLSGLKKVAGLLLDIAKMSLSFRLHSPPSKLGTKQSQVPVTAESSLSSSEELSTTVSSAASPKGNNVRHRDLRR